jgi:hypothetical protein
MAVRVELPTNDELLPFEASVEFPLSEPAPPAPTVMEIVVELATVFVSMKPPPPPPPP